MTHPNTALLAYVRARRWSLAEAAQRKLELGAAQVACDTQWRSADQALQEAAGQQHSLLGHAQFRAGDLLSRRHIHAAVAAELMAVETQRDALQTQAEALDAQIAAQRQEKLLLERVLDQRSEAATQQQQAQSVRAADALVAARHDGTTPR